jgi:hypothetical protein
MKVGSCGPIFIERGAATRHEKLLRDKIRLSEARFRRRESGGFLFRPSGNTRLPLVLFLASKNSTRLSLVIFPVHWSINGSFVQNRQLLPTFAPSAQIDANGRRIKP